MIDDPNADTVEIGRISGMFGVRGWVRVESSTEPKDNILQYSPWRLVNAGNQQLVEVAEGFSHRRGVVAAIVGIDNRDQARALVGAIVTIARHQLPDLNDEEYYWTDLLGLEVVNRQGDSLGQVDHLMQTGANDVLVLHGERERLVPFIVDQVVLEIDRSAGRILVDWDAEF